MAPQSLWFKQRYVDPILRGEKVDTIRTHTALIRGDITRAQVGPRPHFAWLEVTGVRDITLAEIRDLQHREEVQRTYPGRRRFVEIRFRVLTGRH